VACRGGAIGTAFFGFDKDHTDWPERVVQWHTIPQPEARPEAPSDIFMCPQVLADQAPWGDWMRKAIALIVLAGAVLLSPAAPAAEDLQLNPHLHYGSNRPDGPLITGSAMELGLVNGKPNYVIIYAERSFNCKRQARRTVSLYQKYRGRVNFVIIDLDRKRSPAQQKIVRKYFKKYLPQVVVTDQQGSAVYNQSGEADERSIAGILDAALQ